MIFGDVLSKTNIAKPQSIAAATVIFGFKYAEGMAWLALVYV